MKIHKAHCRTNTLNLQLRRNCNEEKESYSSGNPLVPNYEFFICSNKPQQTIENLITLIYSIGCGCFHCTPNPETVLSND